LKNIFKAKIIFSKLLRMKKFVLEQVGRGSGPVGNAGFGLERTAVCHMNGTGIKTPALWMGTRGGAVPNLTHEGVPSIVILVI